ncbi:Serine protease snake [Armadillidium nasatum]|uniref:Serine protease snake n=1 Tax=Armadillidium nasatum TaxID=96803 RepID=A0A5N5TIU8_9CRUS|nr:Serine protease snake [Armadillidium nasatum]
MFLILLKVCFLCIFVHSKGEGGPGDECEVDDGVKGSCSTFKECQSTHGIVRRNDTTTMCSPFEGQELFCCRRPFEVARELCIAWKSYWRDNDGKCVSEKPLIVGGEEAGVGQFPEIGILGSGANIKRITWKCGGTLISQYFVLTAAHCVLEIVGTIPTGLFDGMSLHQETRNKAPVEQLILISDVIIHPEYNRPYHDIALLKLEKPVIFTKRVLPACLPLYPEEDFSDKILTVAGWGRIQYADFKVTPTLQKVNIPVIERLKCWEDLKRDNALLIPRGITEEQICAGEEGKDSCQGDSGGPLLLQARVNETDIPCEHTIAGIVSFGSGCGKFGVYTRVSSYLDWITGYIAPGIVPKIHTPLIPKSKTDSQVAIIFPN